MRAHGTVAIVTDTCHYLPRQLVAARGIHEVSLYVNWDGREDREADLPDFDAYYDHLAARRRCRRPHSHRSATSSPSMSRCSTPVVRSSRSTSPAVSGTVAAAEQAKQQLAERGGERIHVVDSASACGGEGLVVLAANAAAARGADGAEVVEHARKAREALMMWFAIDTLEFLRKGGRIGAAQAWLGSALRIKPILTVEEEITPVERVRTSGRAFERMVDYLRERHDDGADGWVIQHIQAPAEAERLVERGREIFGTDPVFVSEVGPVIGTHVGPGLLGVGGIPSPMLA